MRCLTRIAQLLAAMTVLACSTAPVDGLAQSKLNPNDVEVWCEDADWGSYPCGSTGYGYIEAELLTYSPNWEFSPNLNVCRAQRLVRSKNPLFLSADNRSAFWGPDSKTYDPVSEGVSYPHWETNCTNLIDWSANDNLTGKRCSDPSVPAQTRQAFLDFCDSKSADAGNGLEALYSWGKEARDCTFLDQVNDTLPCEGNSVNYSSYALICEWGVLHSPLLESNIQGSASYHCVDDGDTFTVAEPDDPSKGHVTVSADACTCSCVEVQHGYTCFSCYKFAYLGNVEEVARDPLESDISSGIPVPGVMVGPNYTGVAAADAACETLAGDLRYQLYGNAESGQPIYVNDPVWGAGAHGYCDNVSCVHP